MIYLKEAKHASIFCVNCINHKPSSFSGNERSRCRGVCTQPMCREVVSAQNQTHFPTILKGKYPLQVGKWGSNLSGNLYDGHRAGDHRAAASSALSVRLRKQQRANKRHRMLRTNTRCEFFYKKVLKYTLGMTQVNEIVWLTTNDLSSKLIVLNHF